MASFRPAPPSFSPRAQAEWVRWLAIIADADLGTLTAYVQAFDAWLGIEGQIVRFGPVPRRLRLVRLYAAEAVTLAEELGLEPPPPLLARAAEFIRDYLDLEDQA